ncbi:hypothetical protein Trydic_g17305, partial [Trypoxylus dichotomus]
MLTAHLSGKRFEDNDELQDEVRQYLNNLDRTFYEERIQKLCLARITLAAITWKS